MTDDERTQAVWDLARVAFDALGDGFEKLGAKGSDACSALAYYAAATAVQQDVSRADWVRGCGEAYDQAQKRERSRGMAS